MGGNRISKESTVITTQLSKNVKKTRAVPSFLSALWKNYFTKLTQNFRQILPGPVGIVGLVPTTDRK